MSLSDLKGNVPKAVEAVGPSRMSSPPALATLRRARSSGNLTRKPKGGEREPGTTPPEAGGGRDAPFLRIVPCFLRGMNKVSPEAGPLGLGQSGV